MYKKKHPPSALAFECPSNRRSGLQSEEPPHNTRRFKDYFCIRPLIQQPSDSFLRCWPKLFARRPLTKTTPILFEQSISSARASVMVYDDAVKKWIPSGSSSGLSKVHIYHHTQHNTFRVVGRKLNDHEVVINCGIVRGLKYNQATATFHQWRDARHVYGLNFSCREDADSFARAMMHTLEGVPKSTVLGRLFPAAPSDSFEVVCPPRWGPTNAAFTCLGSPFRHLGTPMSIGSPSYGPRPFQLQL
ncbi:jg789 [Pararge aegeria aegeria]|uniref:Jg789 protein n=1 Tax=Pararge aegeria aegeria TaxID=348720 RepID=A0A8S4QSC6_9NEOP|nr:jg789 [Pararge aegeria aegeria]